MIFKRVDNDPKEQQFDRSDHKNIDLENRVSASSSISGYGPEMAIDPYSYGGNDGTLTGWMSENQTGNAWIGLDLSEQYELNQLRFAAGSWEGEPIRYGIYLSSDGNDWITLLRMDKYYGDAGSEIILKITGCKLICRYLKFASESLIEGMNISGLVLQGKSTQRPPKLETKVYWFGVLEIIHNYIENEQRETGKSETLICGSLLVHNPYPNIKIHKVIIGIEATVGDGVGGDNGGYVPTIYYDKKESDNTVGATWMPLGPLCTEEVNYCFTVPMPKHSKMEKQREKITYKIWTKQYSATYYDRDSSGALFHVQDYGEIVSTPCWN